eukprot:7392056-Lingulodinium_polyedra.AAC.1
MRKSSGGSAPFRDEAREVIGRRRFSSLAVRDLRHDASRGRRDAALPGGQAVPELCVAPAARA